MTDDYREGAALQRGGIAVEGYRFSRGAETLLLTSAAEDLALNGETYLPAALSRERIEANDETMSGAVEISLPHDEPVAAWFRAGAAPLSVAVTIIRVQRGTAASDEDASAVIFSGTVQTTEFGSALLVLTCLPLGETVERKIPRPVAQVGCNWSVYGPECGVARAGFALPGTISRLAGDGVTLTVTAAAGEADGYFTGGWIEVADGAVTARGFIVSHVGASIILLAPLDAAVAGASVTLYAGCDRTAATCNSKFANLARFMGFPLLPTVNPFTRGIS